MNRPDDSPKNSILIYTTEDGLTKIDTTCLLYTSDAADD